MTDVNSFSGSMENLSGFISAPKWQGENFTYHDGQLTLLNSELLQNVHTKSTKSDHDF
uniref:Uncharacterized protein n=1 Tax=Dunaliella viridis TaxID=140095 RepID=D2SPD4_9CHLO|nr:hypothetical protein [Dunaliella viridis]